MPEQSALVAWLNGLTGYSFSGHGWIAAGLTLVGVAAVYLALLKLMRLSSRGGHDEAVDAYRDPRRDRPEADDPD